MRARASTMSRSASCSAASTRPLTCSSRSTASASFACRGSLGGERGLDPLCLDAGCVGPGLVDDACRFLAALEKGASDVVVESVALRGHVGEGGQDGPFALLDPGVGFGDPGVRLFFGLDSSRVGVAPRIGADPFGFAEQRLGFLTCSLELLGRLGRLGGRGQPLALDLGQRLGTSLDRSVADDLGLSERFVGRVAWCD